MKLKKGLLTVFSMLPLVVSGIALFFLPDRIPGHYGADLTVEAAVAKLYYLFSKGYDTDQIRNRMEVPLCGEMTV